MSERSKRASINSVQWKSAIYIFICMYSFFYGTFTCTSTNNLDCAMNCLAGVALTNTADSSIAHIPWKKRNQIKERREREREARQNELDR